MYSIRKAISQVRTLLVYTLDTEKSFSDFRRAKMPSGKTFRTAENAWTFDSKEIVVTAHIFYPEYIGFFCEKLARMNTEFDVLVTTPNEAIKIELENKLNSMSISNKVILSANRGRNFGPLLVELASEILRYKSFLHIHSKKSTHSKNEFAQNWSHRQIDSLLSVEGISSLATLYKENIAALAYVDSSDLLRGINFRWGTNRRIAMLLAKKIGIKVPLRFSGRIAFPAGGMFWATTEGLREILEHPWSYKDFPPESDQINGTTQHAVERLIGTLVSGKNLKHAVFGQQGEINLL